MDERTSDELRALLSKLDDVIRQARQLAIEIEMKMGDRWRGDQTATNWRTKRVRRRTPDAR